MVPGANPSLTLHAVCAYGLTSSDGFNARALECEASNTQASNKRGTTKSRPRLVSFLRYPDELAFMTSLITPGVNASLSGLPSSSVAGALLIVTSKCENAASHAEAK